MFVFNGYIRSMYVSYIEMCLTVGFQIKMMIKQSSYVNRLQSIMAYGIGAYTITIPMFMVWFMTKYRERLPEKQFRSKVGNMYADIHLNRNKSAVYY